MDSRAFFWFPSTYSAFLSLFPTQGSFDSSFTLPKFSFQDLIHSCGWNIVYKLMTIKLATVSNSRLVLQVVPLYLAIFESVPLLCTSVPPQPSLTLINRKKMHDLKVENYVLFSIQTQGLSLGDSLSESAKGPLRRRKEGARICRNFCNKNQVVRTSEDYH